MQLHQNVGIYVFVKNTNFWDTQAHFFIVVLIYFVIITSELMYTNQ